MPYISACISYINLMKLLLTLIIFFLLSCSNNIYLNSDKNSKIDLKKDIDLSETKETLFVDNFLKTNKSKKSIDLDKIINWWPWKDWIPAINNPKFLTIKDSEKHLEFLSSKSQGLSIKIWWQARFYPYNILVWHEIINDSLWDTKIAITFCPLCWSGIVFERIVEWKEVKFWVSWKLYESNLLMYDDLTETLWSQSLWEALVWDYTWVKLKHIKSNLLTFEQFKNKYPNWEVLSNNTWFNRNYWAVPYEDYDSSDYLYFPVSNTDDRIPLKEIMYIVNNNWESLAFLLQDLADEWRAEIKVWKNVYKAVYNDWLVDVILNWEIIPGYYEMWFSWVNYNKGSENVWRK